MNVGVNVRMIIGCVSLGLGIIFTMVSLIIKTYDNRMREVCKVPVVANVVDIVKEREHDSNTGKNNVYYHPIFEFEVNEEIVRVTYGVGTNPCKFQIGQQVELKYDASNVHRILVEGDKTMQTVAMIFKCVAVLLLVVGVIVLVLAFVWRVKS